MLKRTNFVARFAKVLKPIKRLVEVVQHQTETLRIVHDTVAQQGDTIGQLKDLIIQLQEQQMRLAAGASHIYESTDWMKTLLSACSDDMTLIYNFEFLVKNSDTFWQDILNIVAKENPELFKKAMVDIDEEARQRLGFSAGKTK